jgi:predicted transcriptional regulator
LSTIILPIKPQYAASIVGGEKRYEYRTRLPSNPVSKIVIYETAPVMLCTSVVEVLSVLRCQPEELWKATAELSGVTEEAFRRYFSGRSLAFAYRLGAVRRIQPFRPSPPPQSFKYLV